MKIAEFVSLSLALQAAVFFAVPAYSSDSASGSAVAPAADAAHTQTANATPSKTHYRVGMEAQEGAEPTDEPAPVRYIHSSTIESEGHTKIKCLDPHACCSESAKIIGIVQQMYKAYSDRDMKTVGTYLDPNCTTFDQGTKKLIVGREAVLTEMTKWLNKHAGANEPLLSYTIEHPYCEVSGDNAVVTFTALKEIGGDNPRKYQSRCTDIFKKENGSWLRVHYRSDWKELN